MGTSTDGIICFGVELPDGFEVPWDDYDGEDEWWLEVNGYKPPFEIYDEKGEYIDGIDPGEEKIEEYYNHKRQFEKSYPMPVEIIFHCSYDYPMYIIAVPGTELRAWRGYPKSFDPKDLVVNEKDVIALIDFCKRYFKPDEDLKIEPKWYLCSMWG